jgi:signal transduction histidine kinase
MNIYEHLEQPAKYIEPGTNKMGEDIAFITVMRSGTLYSSDNLEEKVPGLSANEIVNKATGEKGKFVNNKVTYYYLWGERKNSKNLILLSDSYIVEQEDRLLGIILPTLLITIATTIILLFMWSQYVVSKIKKLEKKTKAIITNDVVEGREFVVDDELNELNSTIEQVKIKLKQKDEYKNMMFQNLSHELKTPISVIQSYVEGANDGVIEKDEAIKVIEEETNILSNQVKTILQINKIDYMKDNEKHKNSRVDITKVIITSIEKKIVRVLKFSPIFRNNYNGYKHNKHHYEILARFPEIQRLQILKFSFMSLNLISIRSRQTFYFEKRDVEFLAIMQR